MKNNVKRERGGNPEKKERSVADLFAIFKRNHRARGHTSESRGAEPKVCSVHRQVGPRCEYIFGCVGMKIFSNQIHEESHPLRVESRHTSDGAAAGASFLTMDSMRRPSA